MSYFEVALISREEYSVFEDNRLQGPEIRAGEFYVAMLSLERLVRNKGAAMLPARINEIRPEGNKFVGSVSLFGEDMNEGFCDEFTLASGYWIGVRHTGLAVCDVSVTAAYLRTSGDLIDKDLGQEKCSSELQTALDPALALIA